MNPLAHFFETFGYVVVRGAYDRQLLPDITSAYDAVIESRVGRSMASCLADTSPILPVDRGLEMSQYLVNFLECSNVLPIIDNLLGDDAVFYGSDLSTFRSGSQFHRDQLGDYGIVKVGIYLQDSNAEDGGHFVCIPGSHHFGDRYSELCSHGLRWPDSAGYADNVHAGELDFRRSLMHANLPAVRIDLAVGDAIFFNVALVHSVPASSRVRRLISASFFEGEKSFNSRPRPSWEFGGLSHMETFIALRVSQWMLHDPGLTKPPLNYPEMLSTFTLTRLRRYLRDFTIAQALDIYERIFNRSYEASYRFGTQANPTRPHAEEAMRA